MEFFLHLTQDSKEIAAMLQRAQFKIVENTRACRSKDIFGSFGDGGKLSICTQNIKNSGHDVAFYINETLAHEAVHAAQQCRGGPFGKAKTMMPLPWNKLTDVKKSIQVSGQSSQIEHEAYWMEDKPNEVKYVLNKYCL